MKIKKSAVMLLLVNVILFATKTTQNAHCIKALQCYRQALNRYAVSVDLSIASVKRQPNSLKKILALKLMGPNDSKVRGTKWCVVILLLL